MIRLQRSLASAGGVVVVGMLARVALAAAIGLGVDESYAVAVANPVSLSYFDHPPLAFWIAAVGPHAFGAGHDVLLRLPFILLFAATSWLLFRLTNRLFGDRAAFWTVALAQILPVFGISDGGWILPDGPLLFGFAATALSLAHVALDGADSREWHWWIGAGFGAGIAALSKYHAIFLVAGTILFLLTSARQRRWLVRPEPYLAASIALAMAMPVFLWNAGHGWASFRFQGGRAGIHFGWHSLMAFAQNLAGQAGYLLPWVWFPLLLLFIRAARHGPNEVSSWLLVCLGGGPVVVFSLISLGGRPGLPHWPAPGFFLLLPLLGDALAQMERNGRARAVRGYVAGSAVLVVILVSFAASQIRSGWFSQRFPALFARGDPSLDAVDWKEVRSAFAAVPHPLVVAADWIDAAKLGAALPARATVLCFSADQRHFRYVADEQSLIGSNAVIVLRAGPRVDVGADRRRIATYFGSVDSAPAREIDVRRGGNIAVRLMVFRATGLLWPYPR